MPPKKMLYDKRLQKIENLVSSGIIQRDSWHDSLVWAVNEGRLSFAQITEIEQLGREARSMLLNLSYDDRAKAVSDVKSRWQSLLDRDSIKFRSDFEKKFYSALYNGVSRTVSEPSFATNVLPFAVSGLGEKVKSHGDDILDALYLAGFPEQVLESNAGVTSILTSAKTNDVVSRHPTFTAKDKQGREWHIKVSDDEKGSEREASAGYYLAPEMGFLIPSKFPIAIDTNGMYMTFHKKVVDDNVKGIDYWIKSLAALHANAQWVLKKNNVEIEGYKLREESSIADMVDSIKGICGINVAVNYDAILMDDAIRYLNEIGPKCFIHGDLKGDNLLGKYMVDLEGSGIGHPALDLAMVLMGHKVPVEEWDMKLVDYLSIKGTENSFDNEFRHLKEGVQYAAIYTATKEILGSSMRELRADTILNNQLLATYLVANAKQSRR